MTVPASGSFKIFGTTDQTSIQQSIEEGGANTDSIDDFNDLISASSLTQFDSTYSGNLNNSLNNVTNALQYRGYPVLGSRGVGSITASFGGTSNQNAAMRWKVTVNLNGYTSREVGRRSVQDSAGNGFGSSNVNGTIPAFQPVGAGNRDYHEVEIIRLVSDGSSISQGGTIRIQREPNFYTSGDAGSSIPILSGMVRGILQGGSYNVSATNSPSTSSITHNGVANRSALFYNFSAGGGFDETITLSSFLPYSSDQFVLQIYENGSSTSSNNNSSSSTLIPINSNQTVVQGNFGVSNHENVSWKVTFNITGYHQKSIIVSGFSCRTGCGFGLSLRTNGVTIPSSGTTGTIVTERLIEIDGDNKTNDSGFSEVTVSGATVVNASNQSTSNGTVATTSFNFNQTVNTTFTLTNWAITDPIQVIIFEG